MLYFNTDQDNGIFRLRHKGEDVSFVAFIDEAGDGFSLRVLDDGMCQIGMPVVFRGNYATEVRALSAAQRFVSRRLA